MAGSNHWIVTTTINPPTAAIRQYDSFENWNLLVVGDERTPPYKLQRGTYLSWAYQQGNYTDLCELLGPNSVQRGRMIAFIEAWKRGCDVMASVDDDCYPMDGWGSEESIHVGKPTKVKMFDPRTIAFDPYSQSNIGCRHRGFPRELASSDPYPVEVTVVPLVQENHSKGDPDIDAIDRIANRPSSVGLSEAKPFGSTSFCPINTQNTFFAREAIPDFYGNIPGIGRMDDIWAGYIFQAMHPGTVIYASANNVQMQNRTLESMLKDLEAEMFGYRNTTVFLEYLAKGKTVCIPSKGLKAIELYKGYFA